MAGEFTTLPIDQVHDFWAKVERHCVSASVGLRRNCCAAFSVIAMRLNGLDPCSITEMSVTW